jgi:hypothetical protein
LIETLNEKISKAEQTIGRLLEEKMALTNGTINPMIDLHLLASDSNNVSKKTKYETDNIFLPSTGRWSSFRFCY